MPKTIGKVYKDGWGKLPKKKREIKINTKPKEGKILFKLFLFGILFSISKKAKTEPKTNSQNLEWRR